MLSKVKLTKIVRNSGSRGAEHPDANLWPEWQPYDTTPTKRAARMMIALTTASSGNWDIEFPALKKTVSLQKSDACKSLQKLLSR
jgi:hypothetical protein